MFLSNGRTLIYKLSKTKTFSSKLFFTAHWENLAHNASNCKNYRYELFFTNDKI